MSQWRKVPRNANYSDCFQSTGSLLWFLRLLGMRDSVNGLPRFAMAEFTDRMLGVGK